MKPNIKHTAGRIDALKPGLSCKGLAAALVGIIFLPGLLFTDSSVFANIPGGGNGSGAPVTITTNGTAVVAPVVVELGAMGAHFDDYHLDTFAVESYSQVNSEPPGSILAHGTIGNLVLVVPPPPVALLQVALAGGVGQVLFASRTNWNYVLQSSADFQTWVPAGPPLAGTGGNLILQDTNSPQPHQFYRIDAVRAD